MQYLRSKVGGVKCSITILSFQRHCNDAIGRHTATLQVLYRNVYNRGAFKYRALKRYTHL